MTVFSVGALTFSLSWIVNVATALILLLAAKWRVKRDGIDTEPLLWRCFVLGGFAARLSYVLRHWEAYRPPAQPLWGVIDIRDGGFDLAAGLVLVALLVAIKVIRVTAWRRPLAWMCGVAILMGSAGTLAAKWIDAEAPRLPTTLFPTTTGASLSLPGEEHLPVVVNLWASWCGYCRKEMPMLAQAQAGRRDLRFVFVNQGETAAVVQHYLAKEPFALQNVVLDAEETLSERYSSTALPSTLFFDAEGKLLARRVGLLSQAALDDLLDQLAAPRRSSDGKP